MRHRFRRTQEAEAKQQHKARRKNILKSNKKDLRQSFMELPGYNLVKHEFRDMLGLSLNPQKFAAKNISKKIQSIFQNNSNTCSIDSKYYKEENLNTKVKSKGQPKISVISINARSLSKNSIFITALVDYLSVDFDCMVISEIWTTNIEFMDNLFPGYTFIYEPPKSSHVGGVGIYYKKQFKG